MNAKDVEGSGTDLPYRKYVVPLLKKQPVMLLREKSTFTARTLWKMEINCFGTGIRVSKL
jgi:hypothetical protein